MYKLILKHSVKNLFLLLFMFISEIGIAQSDTDKFLPNIVPPSPTAGELGKFGNVPVGLFTGAANISVPLITFKTKDLESPISLFYGSNGIKVDEVSSNVGLGWNMNFGGVITRTVRDKLDEPITAIYPPDDLSNATTEQRVQFYRAAGQENADTESDIYSFNFNGNSGKFVYDKNGAPVLINNQKIKIERTGNQNADFLLTATNGVKYYFTEKETTTFISSGGGHSIPVGSVTAWYLSKIVHPNGSEIYLTYENYTMNYVASNSQSLIMSYPPIQEDCFGVVYAKAPALSGIISQNMSVIGKRITKIFSDNTMDGYVTFTYNIPGDNEEVSGDNKIENITLFNKDNIEIEKIKFGYLKTVNKRVFLQNIIFLDPTKKYSFEYINQDEFPERLSYSQDHWGYYNGKNNINLVPKNIAGYNLDLNNIDYNGADKEPDKNFAKIGLLSKIVYPTKGYTEFDYESNTYWGEKTTYPTKTNLNLQRSPEDNNVAGSIYTISSPINQRIAFLGRVNYVSNQPPIYDQYGNLIPDPSYTGHFSAAMQISSTDAPGVFLPFYELTQFGVPYTHQGGFTFINSTETQFVDNVFYFDAEAGKTYTLVLYKNGIRAAANVEVSYYATAPVTANTNIETGGVRIKSTKDFAIEGSVPVYKRYYYANKDNINQSSGNNGKMPLYLDIATQRKVCSSNDGMVLCLYTTLFDLVVSSSSMISLFDTGNSNCFYEYVTVSQGGDTFENGGEMKQFIVDRDGIGNIILGQTEIKSAPLTNFGWDNGLEIKSEVFQKRQAGSEFVIVSENENKYKLDSSYNKEIKAYSVRKNYEEPCPLSQTVENFSIVEYKTKGYWFYLESSTAKTYDLKGLNPIETTTTYQYDPVHLQLTSQSTESSSQETLQTRYYYPQDAVMSSEPFVNDMITANRIDTPLKTETFRSNVLQSGQKTLYAKDASTSNLLLPKFIFAAKFPNSNTTADDLKRKITYDKYDDTGNILQYTPEAGLPVSIIWGYNKTQPIAKIENKAYQNIPVETITNLQTLSNTDKDNCLSESCSEQLLRNALNVLRNSLSDSFVTTYTYNPLVGVTSITDPKGMASYYEYDAVGRLKFVKDNELNVLQKYCYNYKGQQTDCGDNTSTTVISYKSIARSGLFTKNNCPAGGSAGSIDYSQEIGAVISDISQTDADDRGLIKFNADGQAYANTNAKCTFWNVVQSQLITRNNCAAGGTPDSALYTVPAARYFSNLSQSDADAQAQAEINTNGQAFANANAKCTFWNFAKTQAVTRNNCPAGGTPDNVLYTVPAGRYFSNFSQADADAQAQAEIDTNGQAYANTNAKCTFWNIAKNQLFTRNNCGAGGIPESVYYNVAAGKYSSNLSQADADMQAQAEIDSNGQAYGNANAKCTYWNVARSQAFTRNNCTSDSSPGSTLYSVPAGKYFSNLSQSDADAQAQTEINTNGQAFANATAKCTFYSIPISGSFTRNNCGVGFVSSSVSFSQAYGVSTSTNSQTEADSLGLAKFNTDGQNNANNIGICTPAGPVYTFDYTYSPASLSMTLFAYCSIANHPAVTFNFIITYLSTANKLLTLRRSIVLGANQLSASLTLTVGGVNGTQHVELEGSVQ